MWGKRFSYFSFMALILFGLLFYHHYAMMIWVVILAILPVFSFLFTRLTFKRIRIGVSIQKKSVGKNVPVDVQFAVKNGFIAPIENLKLKVRIYHVFYKNIEEYEVVIPSVPFTERKVSMKISGKYCGRMIVRIEKVVMEDFLGLFRFEEELDLSDETAIMPESNIELPQINLSTSGVANDDEVQYVKGDDVSQISQIRNYIPGDKLQNIHWKLSAKNEELQVKEFSKPYSDEVTLLVELSIQEDKPEITDSIIEAYYASGRYLLKNGRRFRAAWFNTKTMELFETKIETGEELDISLYELYYMTPYENPELTYDSYMAIHSEPTTTVMYISDAHASGIQGERLDICDDKVVITCLSVQ